MEGLVAGEDDLFDVDVALAVVLAYLLCIAIYDPVVLKIQHAQVAIQDQFLALEDANDLFSLDVILAYLEIFKLQLVLLL